MKPPRRLCLEDWLGGLPVDPQAQLLIGCTGHLLLDRGERANIERHLETTVFPALLHGHRSVAVICGMAPGADLLFLRTADRWLRAAGTESRRIALLPLPLELLLEDWSDKAAAERKRPGEAVRRRMREELQTIHDTADTLVELTDDDSDLDDPLFRQQCYRRLAAVLAEQSDVLVALLRDQHLQKPGGTAEVVEWRRHPRQVPPELSTLALRRPHPAHRLWVIDPSLPAAAGRVTSHFVDAPPMPAPERRVEPERRAAAALTTGDVAAVVAAGRRALQSGNYLRCYDLVRQAQERQLRSRELDYLSLLALANAGSTALALERYRALGLDENELDEDWLALEGRLLKDRALHTTGGATPALLWAAAQAYLRAFRRTGGRFTGINAATLFLLADQPEQSLALARTIADGLTEPLPADETAAYYRHATEAEAALLLGDEARCRAALRYADRHLRGNLNVRSRTAAQLRRICRKRGDDESLLEALTLAPVLYLPLTGMPSPQPAPSFVFAGLTHPRDLPAIEAAFALGAPLHLVLPAAAHSLTDRWNRHHDPAATTRLVACLERAQEVSIARGFVDDEEAWCAEYVAAMACGLSKLTAQQLGSGWQVAGTDSTPPSAPPASVGGNGGYARQQVGTLFADFVGFTRLDDAALPAFWRYFTGVVESIRQRHGARILYHRTWGDALHIVAVDAAATADIAVDLRDSLDRLRPHLDPALARLEWRLAAHYAPVFRDTEAAGAPIFFGSQLSFAARVEPITPPGMIFVTEAFAARLALEAPARYASEYVGEIDLPKHFGKYRLFNLRNVSPVTL